MLIAPCLAPTGQLDPAPLTSLPFPGLAGQELQAFWSGDDYMLYADGTWYRIVSGTNDPCVDDGSRERAARMLHDVIPLGGSRVAFPLGSTGRTIYRVWRSRGSERGRVAGARTRILGVRAARSLRRPA